MSNYTHTKKREVYDVLETARGAREQPLIFIITTAGFNKPGICYELREYAMKVFQGVVEDNTFFAAIFTLDKDDDKQEDIEAQAIRTVHKIGQLLDIPLTLKPLPVNEISIMQKIHFKSNRRKSNKTSILNRKNKIEK